MYEFLLACYFRIGNAHAVCYSGFQFAQLEMSKQMRPLRTILSYDALFTEAVVAHLIPTFRFSRAKQEIIWKFGNIITPTVDGATQPMVLLKAEKIVTPCAA